MKTYAVEDCDDCPFLCEAVYCNVAPDGESSIYAGVYDKIPVEPLPDWCPLRSGPIAVHLGKDPAPDSQGSR